MCRRKICAYGAALIAASLVLSGTVRAADPPSAVGPFLKLYRSGRLPAERQPTVLEMICGRGNEHDLRFVFDRIMSPAGMSPELRLKALSGLTEAALQRGVAPSGDLAALGDLVSGDNARLRLAALRLAAACRVEAVGPAMRKIAVDADADSQSRRTAIEGLISTGGAANQAVLEELAHKAPTTPLRIQAAAGLVGMSVTRAAELAADIFTSVTPNDDTGPLLDAFFLRKEGADRLADALRDKTISVDVAKRALRTMYSSGRSDAALSDVLSTAAGVATDAPPPTPEELSEIVHEVAQRGDPAHGEQVFRSADVGCMRCHSINRAGGQVGPDLSAVGGSSPLDYIANSILNPNLAVKEQYITRIFETVDGRVLTGVVADRDEGSIRLRDAQGKLVVIPTSDVDAEYEGPTMMPTGLTKFLTRDELIDLIKFVSSLGKPGDYAVQTVPAIQRFSVLNDPPPELTDAVPHLDHIREYALGAEESAWMSAYAKVNGFLPLDGLRENAASPILILRGEIQVNAPGLIHVAVESSAPAQVWIDAQPFVDKSEFETKVDAGRHQIIVRVDATHDDAEVRVRVTKPAEDGAQFEVIGGA
jgi:putative heme-binding domain-containing protein